MSISLEALLASAQARANGSNAKRKKQQSPPSESKRTKAAKRAASRIKEEIIPPPLHGRLRGPRWRDEALVLYVTEQQCECGAHFTAPSPYAFVSRYHPQYGKHLQPLPHAAERQPLFATLPRRVEYTSQSLTVCPECFTPEDFAPDAQEQIDFGYENSVQATPEPEVMYEEILYIPRYHLEHLA